MVKLSYEENLVVFVKLTRKMLRAWPITNLKGKWI